MKKKNHHSGRSAFLAFLMAATASGFAFGALMMSLFFPASSLSNALSYEKGSRDAWSDLVALGAFGREELRLAPATIISIDGRKVGVRITSFPPAKLSRSVERTMVLTDSTEIVVKQAKSLEQIKADERNLDASIATLEEEYSDLKRRLADCGSLEGEDCSLLRKEMDVLIRARGSIAAEKSAAFIVNSGSVADLRVGGSVVVVSADDILSRPEFEAVKVELLDVR